jgi:hypothetical protein
MLCHTVKKYIHSRGGTVISKYDSEPRHFGEAKDVEEYFRKDISNYFEPLLAAINFLSLKLKKWL